MNEKFSIDLTPDADGDSSGGLVVQRPSYVAVEIKNTGANPVTAFAIEGQVSPEADWFTYVDGAELVDATKGFQYRDDAAIAPASIGSGETLNLVFEIVALAKIRFKVTSASGTTLTLKGQVFAKFEG